MNEDPTDSIRGKGMCKHGNFLGSCEQCKVESEDPHGPEAIAAEIQHKAEMIRQWALESGLEEGKDLLVIEDNAKMMKEGDKIAPHEKKSFSIGVLEEHYMAFKEFILGQYREQRKKENPDEDLKLDYSWGGRFLVGWDGVPFDTVPMQSVDPPKVRTRHKEFLSFFKEQTGLEFPSAETLNPLLTEIGKKGKSVYEEALEKMAKMKDNNELPDDGHGIIDLLEHALIIFDDAERGEAVEDLPEVIEGKMPDQLRHYADLTYNAEDVVNFDRITEISGVEFPDEIRLDKIFDRWGFDRNKMEELCREFSTQIFAE